MISVVDLRSAPHVEHSRVRHLELVNLIRTILHAGEWEVAICMFGSSRPCGGVFNQDNTVADLAYAQFHVKELVTDSAPILLFSDPTAIPRANPRSPPSVSKKSPETSGANPGLWRVF